ncbi:MAG: rod shape-determining protein RodA [Burkholderiaceae bacterium]|nr:rod shape-determining protein RodA [Burkholderiaceae bacterium]
MTTLHQAPSLWSRVRPHLLVFDPVLTIALAMLVVLSFVTMQSAALDYDGRVADHARNLLVAFGVLWLAANLPLQWMQRIAPPAYLVGLALLVAVALFGDVAKGARRWLDLGFTRIQPSELMKIAMPMMLAWWFQKREGAHDWVDFVVAAVLLAVPLALIVRQPDLGTAILVFGAGFYVIYLAGLGWKLILGGLLGALASMPVLWSMLHEYQRQRVLMMIDPSSDPLGRGFHVIQSTIAVGSGGIWGKGWMQGTQAHLEFIPERTTDFVFAVFSEEFGMVGNLVLLGLYLLVIGRGLVIAANGANVFARLLAGSITLILFTYAFVNIGMVSGILPVVGVPLPMMSYGGTAMLTLGIGMGLLMSIARQRRLVQT